MKSLCSLLNVKQIYTSSRHPQTNSRAESYNKNILNSLRTRCESEPNWPDLLPTIGNSSRTSVAKNLGVSPYQVVFGRPPLSSIDHLLIPPDNLPISAKQYFEKMQPQLEILRESVRQNQLHSSTNTKKMHDAHGNVKIPKFAVGNRVWLSEQLPSKVKLGHKTNQKFKGPFLIVKANPDFYTYKLQNCKNNKIHPSLIHANRLRLCDTERDKFYFKIAVKSDTETNKTVIDSSMAAGHKQVGKTRALALPLQTADNTAAATTVPAAPIQSANAVRKQRRKQRIFYRSKAAGSTSQTAATAQCATNDTQAQVLTRDKQTSRPTVCSPTAAPPGEQTVSSQPTVQDGLLSSSNKTKVCLVLNEF